MPERITATSEADQFEVAMRYAGTWGEFQFSSGVVQDVGLMPNGIRRADDPTGIDRDHPPIIVRFRTAEEAGVDIGKAPLWLRQGPPDPTDDQKDSWQFNVILNGRYSQPRARRFPSARSDTMATLREELERELTPDISTLLATQLTRNTLHSTNEAYRPVIVSGALGGLALAVAAVEGKGFGPAVVIASGITGVAALMQYFGQRQLIQDYGADMVRSHIVSGPALTSRMMHEFSRKCYVAAPYPEAEPSTWVEIPTT